MRADYFSSLFLCDTISCPAYTTSVTRRAPAANAPGAARFLVQLTLDENYKSATDKPNQLDSSRPNDTGKSESRLHLEVQASRWVVVAAGDGGATEIRDLEGGEPPSASGAVSFGSSEESRSDNAPGDKGRVESKETQSESFSGKVEAADVELSAPQFSELGEGLEFQLKVKGRLQGSCRWAASDEHGTKSSDDCGAVTAGVAEGLTKEGANTDAAKTPETAYVARYEEDFEIHPALSREQQGVLSEQERERAAGAWFGAETRGSRQAGYKITLLKTKTLKSGTHDGVAEEWTQKLTLAAEIIPGAKAASLGPGGDYSSAEAARHPFSVDSARAALRRRRFPLS